MRGHLTEQESAKPLPCLFSKDCFNFDTEAKGYQDIRGDLTEEEFADMYL